MSPPQHEKAIADCDEALRHERTYVKALNRRAGAYEALGKNELALQGMSCY